ncbi:MAG: hypothetical protein IT437_08305 [Phycisphaerales bacterium]|nr:hypothetical protein [Phycisphaerales bacterium]
MSKTYFTVPVIVAACLAAAAALAVAWVGSVQPVQLATLGIIPAAAIGAAIIATRILRLDRMVGRLMFASTRDPEAIIERMVKYADIASTSGLSDLAAHIPRDEDTLIRQGVLLAAANTPAERIREDLDASVEQLMVQRTGGHRAILSVLRIAPSVGLFGLVLCTAVLLLSGAKPLSDISASLTMYLTLSGCLLVTLLLGPAFEGLARNDSAEILARTMIAEGLTSIRARQHPRSVETRLRAMVLAAGAEDISHSLAA